MEPGLRHPAPWGALGRGSLSGSHVSLSLSGAGAPVAQPFKPEPLASIILTTVAQSLVGHSEHVLTPSH